MTNLSRSFFVEQVSGVLTGTDQEVIIMCKPRHFHLNDDYNEVEDVIEDKSKVVGQVS